jgi:nucleoside-diphosphate-sugar epimerase
LPEGVTSSAPFQNPLAADLDHILQHTDGLWEPLRGQNIFVTGGTGFYGRWLLESFAHVNDSLGLGAKLVVLSRDPEAFAAKAPHLGRHAAIKFVRGDIRNFTAAEVRSQLGPTAPEQFRFVIHAATESTGNMNVEDPLRMIETIGQGTRAALEFAVATGAKRFLLTSSGAVYGRQPSDMTHVPETYLGGPDPLSVSSSYAESKRMAELLCASYYRQHGLEPLITRGFAFVGPFLPLDAHFAIGNFIRDALRGGPIAVNGDGTPYRSYLYAADLAIWLWTILLKGQPCRAYNVGSEDAHTIHDLAKVVAKVCGGGPVQVKEKPDPAKPPHRYVPSCRRAVEELGLQPWIELADGIRRTAEFAAKG